MSANIGQRMDSSNILFYFDADNPKCYTSGRTCNELIYNDTGNMDNLGSNEVQFTSNGLQSSMTFNGLDYIDFGSRIRNIAPSLPITIESWVKLGTNTTFNGVVSLDNRTSAYAGVVLQIYPEVIGSTYRVEAAFGTNGGFGSGNRRSFNTSSLSQELISQNVWTHIVVVFVSNNDIRVYFNGVLISGVYSGSATVPVWSTIGTLILGQSWGAVGNLVGDINTSIVWNRLMSATEVISRYDSTKYRFGL
jgi:hypothetical protein